MSNLSAWFKLPELFPPHPADRVYFMRRPDGLIKVGYSRHPVQRLAQLRRSGGAGIVLLGMLVGGQCREVHIHTRFRHLRRDREWFEPGADLLEFMDQCMTPWLLPDCTFRRFYDRSCPHCSAVFRTTGLVRYCSQGCRELAYRQRKRAANPKPRGRPRKPTPTP